MTFSFEPRKRDRMPANPAKSANPTNIPEQISGISNISGSTDALAKDADPHGHGYTQADLTEMDRLLRQLAELEGWTPEELADMLDQRRRMAPVNVPKALKQLGEANAAALAPWPNPPKERAKVVLCVITGGRK